MNTTEKQPPRSQDVLVWTDIETTGLDPERDVVLEVGMIATDYELQPIDGVKDLHLVIRPRRLKLLRMDDVPIHMHLHNGLLSECARSHIRGMDAATRISQWLTTLRAQSGRLVLAGSSVHFDRRFLDRLHPPFIGHVLDGVDHRMLDVSTLDEIARHLHPDTYKHRPERTTDHRVMHCLADTMHLYRYYLDNLIGKDPSK